MFLPSGTGRKRTKRQNRKYVFREAEDFMIESTMEALFAPFLRTSICIMAFAEQSSFSEKCWSRDVKSICIVPFPQNRVNHKSANVIPIDARTSSANFYFSIERSSIRETTKRSNAQRNETFFFPARAARSSLSFSRRASRLSASLRGVDKNLVLVPVGNYQRRNARCLCVAMSSGMGSSFERR